tara:strand:- start:1571 stop:1972 length:402 start_codon:yes stop_codon:yes gene_type:complete
MEKKSAVPVRFLRGCTEPPGTLNRVLIAFIAFTLVTVLLLLLERHLVKSKSWVAVSIAAFAGACASIFAYMASGRVRGMCVSKDLFEFYHDTLGATPMQAVKLVNGNQSVFSTYILVVMIWVYMCLRLGTAGT